MSTNLFQQVLRDAIADMSVHGFDHQWRIDRWVEEIRAAAIASLIPEAELEQSLRDALKSHYERLVDQEKLLQRHQGADRFTIARLKPKLRDELDKRILTSANLISLNRQQRIDETLRRFSGWASSIPAGGSKVVKKGETKEEIRQSLASLPFLERHVLIDQGHKLSASLSEIIANDGGALAGIWNSHWRQAGYNYRPDHKERDSQVYAVRDNWAIKQGLMKAGPAGYTDAITKPAEEVYCRCYYQWLYSLRKLPDNMLTIKGRNALEQVKVA